MIAQDFRASPLPNYNGPLGGFPPIERLGAITTAVRQRTRLLHCLFSVALCLHLHLASVSCRAQSVVQFASDHGEVTEGDYGNLRLSIEPPAAEPLVVVI